MENFFYENKCDEIDLVPTNASQLDGKSRQNSLTKMKIPSRPGTSKNKKCQSKIEMDRRNCQTVMGRKSVSSHLKSLKKSNKLRQSLK